MKEFVEYLLKSIVNNPHGVNVAEEAIPTGGLTLNVELDPADVGLVIGRKGVVVKAIRDLIHVKATKMQKYYQLNLKVPPKPEVTEEQEKV